MTNSINAKKRTHNRVVEWKEHISNNKSVLCETTCKVGADHAAHCCLYVQRHEIGAKDVKGKLVGDLPRDKRICYKALLSVIALVAHE